MDISVIICTYNRAEYLRKVLIDLAGQDVIGRICFEVIIVDNNSTDNTRQVGEEFIAKYPEVFRYVFEARQGKTFALNTGIRESKGSIVAFTDDDVVIDNNWVFSVKQAFAANQACKAFGGRVLPLWPDTVPQWIAREGDFENTKGTIVEHDLGDCVKKYSQAGVDPPIGANMFFAREVLDKYGGFNESLNLDINTIPMLEDTEFCNRLLKCKEEMTYIPDSVVYHPVYPERLTKNYFRKHAFKTGRAHYVVSDVKRNGQYVILNLQKNRRRLLNIPFYMFKCIITNLIKYFVATLKRNPQEILHLEKLLLYYMGLIYELYDKRKMETSTATDLTRY